MKIYNSPEQARSLREIEATALSSTLKTIEEVNGTVNPEPANDERAKETEQKEVQATSKKERKKKDTSSL